MPRATITFFFAFSAPSAFLQRPLREQTKRWHFILKSSADQEMIFAVTSKISPAKEHHCNNCAKNNDDQRRQVNSSFTITAIHTALLLPICLSLNTTVYLNSALGCMTPIIGKYIGPQRCKTNHFTITREVLILPLSIFICTVVEGGDKVPISKF